MVKVKHENNACFLIYAYKDTYGSKNSVLKVVYQFSGTLKQSQGYVFQSTQSSKKIRYAKYSIHLSFPSILVFWNKIKITRKLIL